MLRGHRAAIAAVFAIAGAAAVTAGCGGGSTSNALALDPVAAAATKSQHAGAARVRFAVAVQSRGKLIRLHGAGAIDGTSSKLAFRLGSMLGRMGLPAATAAKLAQGSIQEIALEENGDYVVYLRLGFLASQLPGGKRWVKLDISKLGKSAGLDFEKLMSGSQLQPTDLLGMLRGEGAKVRKVGQATIDGAATTHYRVTIDLAKALEAKGLTTPLLGGIAAQMKTITENVWIGRSGLVRRVALAYNLPLAGMARLAMTMDIYDYGAHVSIAAPPRSEVFDATQLAQSGLGQALLH
jgi:hypothetical protein